MPIVTYDCTSCDHEAPIIKILLGPFFLTTYRYNIHKQCILSQFTQQNRHVSPPLHKKIHPGRIRTRICCFWRVRACPVIFVLNKTWLKCMSLLRGRTHTQVHTYMDLNIHTWTSFRLFSVRHLFWVFPSLKYTPKRLWHLQSSPQIIFFT
jgi:hypothetical protein